MSRRGKPPTSSQAERRGIQSVEVSARILAALSSLGQSASLKSISDLSEIAPSNVHRYLSSLVKTGLAKQNLETGEYDLGPAALQLGLAALSRFDVVEQAYVAMKELSATHNITCLLSVWGEQGPTIVRWSRAKQQLVTSLNLGSILPVLSSSTGRVFLAFLPSDLTANLVSKELRQIKKANQPSTITNKQDVNALITQVREAGLATVDSNVIPGLRAVAAPIMDIQSEAVATITMIGVEQHLLDPTHAATRMLADVCKKLSIAP